MLDSQGAAVRSFHVLGKWIVAAPFLKRLLTGPGRAEAWREFGAISNLSSVGLAALMPRQRIVKAACGASALVLRNNIRAIYPERGLTVKLANPARPESQSAIRNEAVLRGRLKETARIGVPVIRRSGTADHAFIVEEFIVGAERRKTVPANWTRALFEFYEANGLEARNLDEVMDPISAFRTFTEGCRALGVSVSDRLTEAYRPEAGSFSGGRLLVGLCHGDLAPSNLLFTGGRTLIVDWEYGGRDLLLSDVARLASGDDGFRRLFLAEVAAWSDQEVGPLLSPERQLLAGCLLAANRRLERFQGFLATAPRSSLVRKYRAKVQAIVDVAAALLPSNWP